MARHKAKVRGAPTIGIADAYGLYLGVHDASEDSFLEFVNTLREKSGYLASSRSTAVNLFWAMERMEKTCGGFFDINLVNTGLYIRRKHYII